MARLLQHANSPLRVVAEPAITDDSVCGEVALDIPKEFFTLQSMLTLTGATGSVFVISNGLQRAFDFNPRWLALAVSQVIVLGGVYMTGGTGIDYFVGLVNGFLVYCTAAGATLVGAGTGGGGVVARDISVATANDAKYPQANPYRRRFLTSWF